VNIGDCKCFIWKESTKKVIDATLGNRNNLTTADIKDCGGRLGPYTEKGEPDLRNLDLNCAICEEGDIIILVSDGVHDNLDPQQIGIPPYKLLGAEALSIGPETKWADLDGETATRVKNELRCTILEKVVTGRLETFISSSATSSGFFHHVTPAFIATRLIEHCRVSSSLN